MKKTAFLAGILALASMSIAFAKSYEVSFARVMQAGTVQLKPGSYELQVAGDKATFIEVEHRKKTTVTVKVENAAKKFDTTLVNSTLDGNTGTIKNIQLGGSTTQIDF
jgi:hypothetical protein